MTSSLLWSKEPGMGMEYHFKELVELRPLPTSSGAPPRAPLHFWPKELYQDYKR